MRGIRRILLLVMAAALLAAGAGAEGNLPGTAGALRGYDKEAGYVYVTLGQYPQTKEGGLLPILWRVLEVDGEKAYLLSEYILFARCMNASLKDYRDELKGDFGKTEMCQYLNTTFAQTAFTEQEMNMLTPLEGVGKVFLPSADDLKKKEWGLGTTLVGSGNLEKIMANPGLRAWGTEWAIENNGFDPAEYPDVKVKYEGSSRKPMPLKELRLFVYSNGKGAHSPYWTRDNSTADARHARCIKADGSIGHIEVGRDNEGARPGIYLRSGAYQILGGSGTKEDPYRIGAAQ